MKSNERSHVMGEAVIASTAAIVTDALHGNWLAVLDTSEQRRRMLEQLELTPLPGQSETQLCALRAAVYESERAVAKIIAHAMICKQSGSEAAAFH